ncbi:MAG: diguanylate cyclase [Chloroflexota bacterium]
MDSFSQKLANLHEIHIELSQTEPFGEICRLAIHLGCKKLGFDRLGLWLTDPEHPETLRGTFCIDEAGRLRDTHAQRIAVGEEIFHRLLSMKRSAIYYEPHCTLRDDDAQVIGTGEFAAAGLWNGKQMVGLIYTDNLLRQKGIDEQQRQLLVLYAQFLANLLSSKRAEDNLRHFARQQLLLNEITRAALELHQLPEILQNMADRLGEMFLADHCYIVLWDKEERTAPGTSYGAERNVHHDHPLLQNTDKTLAAHIRQTHHVLLIADTHNSPYIEPALAASYPEHSLMILPLTGDKQFLGAALIGFHHEHAFKQDDIYIGEQAAQQIAMAILKTRLLEESQRRATEAETLRQAAAAVVSTLKQDEVVELILEQLNRVVPYDSACLVLPDGEEHVVVGARGFSNRAHIMGLRFTINAQTPNAIVYAQRTPYILEDAPAVYEAFRHPPHRGIRGWMGVPLLVHDKMIGMLALDSHQPNTFTPDHARLASAFADQVAIALENTRLFEETQRLAVTDTLTDLYNRRHFMEIGRSAYHHARRYQKALSIILFDIDHFKIVNDTCGHHNGDQVLLAVAQECRCLLRETDEIARYGGEEFIVLLPETPACNLSDAGEVKIPPAASVAERLRQAVAETLISTENAHLSVTISLGVAELDDDCPDFETLIDRADQALYHAKHSGRNRVAIWQPDDEAEEVDPINSI